MTTSSRRFIQAKLEECHANPAIPSRPDGILIGNARPFVIRSTTQFDAWETARLLALVQLAEFDSYVASLESKNHCSFWRPVTAVELAAT